MAADKPEVIIFNLDTLLFDIWTETLLFNFLKRTKLAETTLSINI